MFLLRKIALYTHCFVTIFSDSAYSNTDQAFKPNRKPLDVMRGSTLLGIRKVCLIQIKGLILDLKKVILVAEEQALYLILVPSSLSSVEVRGARS